MLPKQDGERDRILLDAARQKSLDRIRTGSETDMDVLIVGQWHADRALQEAVTQNISYHEAPRGLSRKEAVVRYGPHWGIGAGGAGVLIALFEMIGKLLGS